MSREGTRKGADKFGEPTKSVQLPVSKIDKILEFVGKNGLQGPVYIADKKGQGASGEEFDLMGQIKANPDSLVYVRVTGESMSGAKIGVGDVLVVDKSGEPKNGDIVVAVVDKKYIVRRYLVKGGKIELKPENSKFPTIKISDESTLEIVGVVKNVFRSFE